MFTGIITAIAEVASVAGGRVKLSAPFDPDTIALGASIACDGCCLTVTEVEAQGHRSALLSVDVSNETFARTNLAEWQSGRRINVERPLAVGDELGGHIVTGHVDGLARITQMEEDGMSTRFMFQVPGDLAPFIAPKGSVALNGTSLTVNEVDGSKFGVNLIPHTLEVTTWEKAKPGDRINLEVDLLARYVARLNTYQS